MLDRVRVLPAPDVLGGELGEQPRAVRVDEHPADLAQRLVPGRAVDRPRHGQLLADAEDLLHQQPPLGPDRRAQPPRVAAGVGQAVRVVHAQPVDLARLHPAQHLAVRGREHLRVLDADGRECRDVEEPPVGQLRCATFPRRQPVVLALVHLLRRPRLPGAGRDGERRARSSAARLPSSDERRARRAPSPRPRPGSGAGSGPAVPVDVEVRRVPRCPAVREHVPPPRVRPRDRPRRRGSARCRAGSPCPARARPPRGRADPPRRRAPPEIRVGSTTS